MYKKTAVKRILLYSHAIIAVVMCVVSVYFFLASPPSVRSENALSPSRVYERATGPCAGALLYGPARASA